MSNLIRMVYASTSATAIPSTPGSVPKDVGRILMQSRKNNPNREIGGVLYFSNNFFFQCLEGGQQEVDQLYHRIATDPRHTDVQILSLKRIDERLFSNWSMKYVALDHQVHQILHQHGHAAFNPYNFTENMIEKMLGLFIEADDKTGAPDQNYARHSRKRGLLSRLFSMGKAA